LGHESKIQEFIHAHGTKSNQDLQAYFNQRLLKILEKHDKIMVGWDEVLIRICRRTWSCSRGGDSSHWPSRRGKATEGYFRSGTTWT